MESENIDFTEQIRAIVAPLAKKPESLLIRRLDKPEDLDDKEQSYVIVCENEDLGRLIGRHGINAGSARTLINTVGRRHKKRIRLTFESFEEKE